VNLAIQTTKLGKHFCQKSFWNTNKVVKAVNSVDLQVRRGELFGLVGPNQAGKTTLIKLLCTLILPSTGNAVVNGFDVSARQDRVRASIGLVAGDDRSFYWRLTGRQNLQFFAALYGLSRHEAAKKIRELFDLLEISKEADISFQKYSSGIKQRMSIARGLLNDPEILFMDEATKSLDPYSAHNMRMFIKEEMVKRRKKTVILTTHNMAEAQEICDRIAVMQDGRIKAEGTMTELRKQAGRAGADLEELFRGITDPGDAADREEAQISA
jgi:ABC-2 type transport system ATP-binding protein